MVVAQSCRLFATPRTAACHAPLSMGFSRQEHPPLRWGEARLKGGRGLAPLEEAPVLGQWEPAPARAQPSGGWVRRGARARWDRVSSGSAPRPVSLLLRSCSRLRLRAGEGCAHHRGAGSRRAQPLACPALLRARVCGNTPGPAPQTCRSPPAPQRSAFQTHCFLTPLFTS